MGVEMLQNKNQSHVHIDLGGNLKIEAESVLKDMGLSLSEAVRIFLRQVIKDREIPFNVRYSADIPNRETRTAIAEVESGNTTKTSRKALKAMWDKE